MRAKATLAAMAVGLILGCAGLMGFGKVQAQAPVKPGQPFEVGFTPDTSGPYKVWLRFDVGYTGPDYGVVGDFSLVDGDRKAREWALKLSSSGAPVEGERGRLTLYQEQYQVNGKGRAKMTIRLVELPELTPGQPVKIRGAFRPVSGTTVDELELVITD